MAKTGTLKDNATREVIYPTTLASNVYDANGNPITSSLPTINGREFIMSEYDKTLNLSPVNNKESWNFNLNAKVESGKIYTISFYCNGYRSFNLKKNNGDGATIKTNSDINGNYQYTFTADWTGDIFINSWESSLTPSGILYSNIMLNEGSNALPYKPYNGAIVHKKDVKPVVLFEGAANNNLTLSDNVENYDYVEIYYDCGNNEGENSIRVKTNYLSSGDITIFGHSIDHQSFPNTYGFVNHYKKFTLRGKSLSIMAYGRMWGYNTDNNFNKDNKNQTWISRILGYKEV